MHHEPAARGAGVAGDLAADVAGSAGQTRAQDAQFAPVAVELLGVGVASRHHRRAFGDAEVGLRQPHSMLVGQAVEALDGGVHQLVVGREADVLELHRGVVSTVTRLRSLLRSAPVLCATRKLSANSSSSLSPSRFLQWLRSERSCGNSCWKNSSPVKYWK